MARFSRKSQPNAPHGEYWDACVFLDLLGKSDAKRGRDAAVLWDDAKKGNRKIYTSEVSIAEVAYVVAAYCQTLTDQDVDAIDALWAARVIHFIALTPNIATKARSIKREFMAHKPEPIPLDTLDAIHLASAQTVPVEAFFTTDEFKKQPKAKKRWLNDQREEVAKIMQFKVCVPKDSQLISWPQPPQAQPGTMLSGQPQPPVPPTPQQ